MIVRIGRRWMCQRILIWFAFSAADDSGRIGPLRSIFNDAFEATLSKLPEFHRPRSIASVMI
jgi:hypothetical protein